MTVPAQANSAQVVISFYAENTANDLREPLSGTTSLSTITIDASGCSSGPNEVTLTDEQVLGSCSAGSQTSTLTLAHLSGTFAYVTVEYKIDSGSWVVHTDAQEADNLTIPGDGTGTTLTASVPDGSSIQWRYKSSDTSGDWSGLSYVTDSDMNSSTVVCSNPVSFSISQALGTCSGGSNTSTLTITNNESSASHFYVEYKIDSGEYTQASANFTLSGSSSNNSTFTQTVPQGSTITWRVTGSDTASNFTGLTGSTTTSSAVDCPQAPSSSSISQSLGSCSGDGGSKTSTLTITNGDSATRYFKVEYSIDGGSYTTVNANFSLGASSSDSTTFTQAVSNGSAITWRVTGSDTDGDFTGLTASTVSSSAVNCNDPSLTVTESFTGSCSSGSKTNTLSILNNESYTAYAYVEYKITDSSGNDSAWTVHPSGSNAVSYTHLTLPTITGV